MHICSGYFTQVNESVGSLFLSYNMFSWRNEKNMCIPTLVWNYALCKAKDYLCTLDQAVVCNDDTCIYSQIRVSDCSDVYRI